MSRRKRPLRDLEAIARSITREALAAGPEIPADVRARLVLGTLWEGDVVVFDLYLPGERPLDAQVLTRAHVDAYSGEGRVEVFDPPRLRADIEQHRDGP